MEREVRGTFCTLDGERFYKIENYDRMEDFFMTITSSSDIWNFCWSQGGVTAGRKDCDHAIFPYYTADKVSDSKGVTGPYTAIAVKDEQGTTFWEPFISLHSASGARFLPDEHIVRNIYKNENGTKVWFEEVNLTLNLSFRYGWTSSAAFGVVRMVRIENRGSAPVQLSVLDGCKNILCASTTATFQNTNSVLLDAYKQTDLCTDTGLAVFSVSSIVSDKAEPNEGLYANVSWFSTDDHTSISPDAPNTFFSFGGALEAAHNDISVLKGMRPVHYIFKSMSLQPKENAVWYQVFDVGLTAKDVVNLKINLSNKKKATEQLLSSIEEGSRAMTHYIQSADGIQQTSDEMTCVHHEANVMFNIMRGGVFADGGAIPVLDFISFVHTKNTAFADFAKQALSSLPTDRPVPQAAVREAIERTQNRQLERLFMEYLPLTFSRRHGDPSRPWNRFNIKLKDECGNPILNYEGNWRDIFQNWEALSVSYPEYVWHFCAVFLNAMTIDGFNPYRITRSGIDWEVPDPTNPWAQFGYWGDHQIIYLQKLLELYHNLNPGELSKKLNYAVYTTSNVPYRLKTYTTLIRDPRNSLYFDNNLSERLILEAKAHGSDKKLVQANSGEPALVSLAVKLLQIIIAKASNLVPEGGIWMNTQRPEWNDANNALAGWGLSVVTAGYVHRMLSFLIPVFEQSSDTHIVLPASQAECLSELLTIYAGYNAAPAVNAVARKQFIDMLGIAFQTERETLYREGYGTRTVSVSKDEIVRTLSHIQTAVAHTLSANKRADGLYHTYNTLHINEHGAEISPLQEMLEGQVSILSSGFLSVPEALDVIRALPKSRLYESRQHSYMLYPNKELPLFLQKNTVPQADVSHLMGVIQKSGEHILVQDKNDTFHFNADFVNARVMRHIISSLPKEEQPNAQELHQLEMLYEKTFNHQHFTGRSGTFYAYEGLGSIYWHMVSKLLLAVQETVFRAHKEKSACEKELVDAYYEVRRGLGFNKPPELYGAFPFDPYSHTPYHHGAKQPGMTGQVKEEILTRWGELGVQIVDGCAVFCPCMLKRTEFSKDGSLRFTWCGTPITYTICTHGTETALCVTLQNGSAVEINGAALSKELSKAVFSRSGEIQAITVRIAEDAFRV